MSQKYINTKTLLKDVVFEEAHGLMAGSSTCAQTTRMSLKNMLIYSLYNKSPAALLLRGIYWGYKSL